MTEPTVPAKPAAIPSAPGGASLPKAQPIVRLVAFPQDANPYGDIFGGWVLAQMDVAGGSAAIRRARGRVATVAVDRLSFKAPVRVGDIVSVYAFEERIGRTSLTFRVELWTQNRELGTALKVTEALFTFVAIDDNRQPRPVPPPEG